MTLFALLLALVGAPTPPSPPAVPCCGALQGQGVGVSYYPHVMANVAAVRARQGYNVRWDLYHVALPDCGMLGRVVWVQARQSADQPWPAPLPVQVMDCSRRVDWGWHTWWGRRVWVELGNPLARRWKVSGTFQARVRWER